jgi:hypothetical protein
MPQLHITFAILPACALPGTTSPLWPRSTESMPSACWALDGQRRPLWTVSGLPVHVSTGRCWPGTRLSAQSYARGSWHRAAVIQAAVDVPCCWRDVHIFSKTQVVLPALHVDPPPADTNGKQWIAQISDFIEQIVGCSQPVVLAGNSLGGYASLATAAARPDLVR